MHYFYCLVTLLLQTLSINIANSTILDNPEVQQIVKQFESNNDFSKYWPLFDQFLSCTIHFTRTLNGYMGMHNSFLERCRYLGYCTTLQMCYFKPVSTLESVLLKAWNRTDLEQVSSTLFNIFLSHRFHQVCTVQLNFSYHDLVNAGRGDAWLFSSISQYKSYFVLPIDFEIDWKSQFFHDTSISLLGMPKFIYLNQNNPAVYMTCLTCNTEDVIGGYMGQFGIIIVKPLIKLNFSSIILGKLDTTWHYYHSNKNNLNSKSVAVEKCVNLHTF